MSDDLVEYKIMLPRLVRDGVEYEPAGEFRVPLDREYWLNACGEVSRNVNSNSVLPHAILRPAWKWPEWLGGWGFAMDKDGLIYWHEHEPRQRHSDWGMQDGRMFAASDIVLTHPSFYVPTITDWTQPILNPNYKEPV